MFANESGSKANLETEHEHNETDAQLIFRCADCNRRVISNDHKDICCCGLKLKDGSDMEIRCVPSDGQDVPLQTEIVAKQI